MLKIERGKKGEDQFFITFLFQNPEVKEMEGEENSYILHTMQRLKFNGMSMRVEHETVKLRIRHIYMRET